MKQFDFERWKGVIDEDNHADEYYEPGQAYQYCWNCKNLMVPVSRSHYKCPVCGDEQDEYW